jgi:hypothetical protein
MIGLPAGQAIEGLSRKDVTMHRALALLSSLAGVVSAIGAAGCSSSGSPTGMGCDTSVAVSFKTDVLPVFQMSCTVSNSCHGQMNNDPEEDLYLGENSSVSATDPEAVYKGLVSVPAKEDPSMPLITAGSLDNSFVWQKVAVIGFTNPGPSASLLAGCAASPAPQCTPDCNSSTPCGGLMPYLGAPLDPDLECALQSWIVQGAKNN